MRCPNCHHENEGESRFCAQCGGALTITCASCGHVSRLTAHFCSACGAPLDNQTSAAPAEGKPDADPSGPAGDRRPVAVLFADISGFTRISSAHDPEDTHAFLRGFFEIVDGLIAQFGGTVDKHIGDCVMAVFGAPIAHGNDAERAVRAAAAIHNGVSRLTVAGGDAAQVHIGIASGEVIAAGTGSSAYEEYTVTGDTVNLASRLQGMAGPGETLISENVYSAIPDKVIAAPVGDVDVRGLPRPISTWRIEGLQDEPRKPPRSKIAGRGFELAMFAGVLTECHAARTGRALYVRGEAGIGKTRLISEFKAIAKAEGFDCHSGALLDFGVEAGRDAIRSVLNGLLGLAADAGQATRQLAADTSVEDGALSEIDRVFLYDLLDLPQKPHDHGAYEAMTVAARTAGKQRVLSRLVAHCSQRKPVCLVIEDLHWAQPATLAYLAALTQAVETCPAVLVMTSRVTGDPLEGTWRGAAHLQRLNIFDLAPLQDREALAMAEQVITDKTAGRRLVETCVERAEGNPFFLEQLLRGAIGTDFTEIPTSIQATVIARIDQLDERNRRALRAASVVGQRFALPTLRFVLDDPGFDPRVLLANRLIHPLSEDRFLFHHALIQETAYRSLLKTQRLPLHSRAAAWFADRDPVLHAQHLDRAEDKAAVQAYLAAAGLKVGGYLYEEALALTERGLAIADERADRFVLTCLKGEILHDLGPAEASTAAYRDSVELAETDADRCRAWIGVAEGLRVSDAFEEAFSALDEAEAAAQPHELALELAHIHHLRGNLFFPLGRNQECLHEHGLSLNFARRAGSTEAEARALGGLGDAEFSLGRMQTSHRNFTQCLELCEANGFERTGVANRSMLGFTWLFMNDATAGLAECAKAIDDALRLGHARAELAGLNVACNILDDMADYRNLEDMVTRTQALVRRLGALRFEAQNLLFLARVRHFQGQPEEALDLINGAWAICEKTSLGFTGPRVLGTKALLAVDPDTRNTALEQGERLLGSDVIVYNHFYFYRDAIEVSLELGDLDAVERYAGRLETLTQAEPLPWTELVIRRARALADFEKGADNIALRDALTAARDDVRQAALSVLLPRLDAALA